MQPRGRDGQPLQRTATRVRKLKIDGRRLTRPFAHTAMRRRRLSGLFRRWMPPMPRFALPADRPAAAAAGLRDSHAGARGRRARRPRAGRWPMCSARATSCEAQWICADKVESRTLATQTAGTDIAPRCGYEHTVHVAAPCASISVLPATPRIVSDIHGQYGLLVRLLRAHQVIDAQDRWALGRTRWSSPAMCSTAAAGHGLLAAVWPAAAGRCRRRGALRVLGNHETMVLYDDLRYVNRSTCAAPAAGPQLPAAVRQGLGDRPVAAHRPVLLKIGDTLFLHGGTHPKAVQLALDRRAPTAYQASLGLMEASEPTGHGTAV